MYSSKNYTCQGYRVSRDLPASSSNTLIGQQKKKGQDKSMYFNIQKIWVMVSLTFNFENKTNILSLEEFVNELKWL